MSTQEVLSGLSVIAGLVVLEGLLSVDNVLGIAALAAALPRSRQRSAIRIGLALAYLFRVMALFAASWLTSNSWVRWLGAGYLIWLMSSHLTKGYADDVAKVVEHEVEEETTEARPQRVTADVERQWKPATWATFAGILLQIGLMDLSLSLDNVVAAVGLAPTDDAGNTVMWPIYAGVLFAILALHAIAPHAVTLLEKLPILEPTAFVLIGYVGVLLLVDEAVHALTGHVLHVPPSAKFAGILLIILTALLYTADGVVRRAVRPLVHVATPVIRGVTLAVSLVMWPLTRAVQVLLSAHRRFSGWRCSTGAQGHQATESP